MSRARSAWGSSTTTAPRRSTASSASSRRSEPDEEAAVAVKIVRKATATWSGTVPDGGGRLALGSGAFEGPFTLRARVEDGQPGANPEELIGLGHAGCFTMSLAD